MKVSIVIPVYFNQDNLLPLYRDMQEKLFVHTEIEWEIVMVNDGSQDNSYQVMQELAKQDSRIRIFLCPGTGVRMRRYSAACRNAPESVQW